MFDSSFFSMVGVAVAALVIAFLALLAIPATRPNAKYYFLVLAVPIAAGVVWLWVRRGNRGDDYAQAALYGTLDRIQATADSELTALKIERAVGKQAASEARAKVEQEVASAREVSDPVERQRQLTELLNRLDS